MNSDELSAYSYEKEILLQDGVQYEVMKREETTMTKKIGDRTYSTDLVKVVLEMRQDKYSRSNKFMRFVKLLIN